jgi:dTDP-4-amino-4,6-dideoxygalactose transaminase
MLVKPGAWRTKGYHATPMAGLRDASQIPTLDLEAHHAPLRGELEEAARRVLRSNAFILGPEVAAFEREVAAVLGVGRAIGVSSGSDALVLALLACGVGPGDEVVTTPFSFFATAGAIARVGARPVFADVEPTTLNLDPEAAIARLGPRTRATLVVHLFGRVARTASLEAACAAAGVPLVEDAAQAIGAWRQDDPGPAGERGQRRPAGAIGRVAALSFFPSKNLGALGDGGLVVTGDAELADRVAQLRLHGARAKHDHVAVGGNFRLDELQAAFLRVKLPHLAGWTARRRTLAAHYREALAGLPLGLPPADDGCVWNQMVVRVRGGQREALARHLATRGIDTAVYYPRPLHLQPALASLGHGPGDFPHAERAAAEVLSLPLYPELADGAVLRVTDAVRGFFR